MKRRTRRRNFNTIRLPSKDTIKKVVLGVLLFTAIFAVIHFLRIISSKPLVVQIGQSAAMWGKSSIHENNATTAVFPPTQSVISYSGGETKTTSGNVILNSMLNQLPLVAALKDRLSDSGAKSVSNQDSVNAQKDQEGHEGSGATTAQGDTFPIEEISITPSNSTGQVTGSKIFINNQTKFSINSDDLLNAKLPFKYNSKQMQVLIIHTHGTESYSKDANALTYNKNDSTRSQNKEESVVRVGDEIRKELENLGVNVVHDTTLHDIPSFNGSYTNALKTINSYLDKYPSIKIVIDVHRDSMITEAGVKYRPVIQIGSQKAAQMMLVMGSSEGGLEHKNWQINLAFAAKLQKRLNELYPNIMRPINLRPERYNEHAAPGSVLIEVGSDANSLDQAITSGKIFAQVLAATLKSA